MEHLPSWLLTQTAAHAGRLVTERFAGIGARGYHYRLLDQLRDGPASQADLGRRTGIHFSDVVAALNELTEGGYVERRPDPADKRRNVVTITAAGRRRATELAATAAAVQEELLAPLNAAERAELVRLLTLIRAGAAAE
jgi:DNA-binding MarR family transcriptional regulator